MTGLGMQTRAELIQHRLGRLKTFNQNGTARIGGDVSTALFYPSGTVGPVPKVLLDTVRLPFGSFNSVNLSNIRSVKFHFDRTGQGALLISDPAFASAPTVP